MSRWSFGGVLDSVLRLAEDHAEHVVRCAELIEDVDVVRLQRLARQLQQRRPGEPSRHDVRQTELLLFVGHLEEQQIGELFDVVAVGQPVVAQDVAVVPELVDERLRVGHGWGFSVATGSVGASTSFMSVVSRAQSSASASAT